MSNSKLIPIEHLKENGFWDLIRRALEMLEIELKQPLKASYLKFEEVGKFLKVTYEDKH